MKYTSQEIFDIIKPDLLNKSLIVNDITAIEYDTRKIFDGLTSLFIAFEGQNTDGHKYIIDAHKKGTRNFIVSKSIDLDQIPSSNIFLVKNVYDAIQKIAAFHRKDQKAKLIGITGSNGKTIVKEWLYLCLAPLLDTVRSPVSFNSQLGVALSLLQIQTNHQVAIIEAGISSPGEMSKLQKMMKTEWGVFTNIGDAHSAGFESREQKIVEKSRLFETCEFVFYCKDHDDIDLVLKDTFKDEVLKSWSFVDDSATIKVELKQDRHISEVSFEWNKTARKYKMHFTDDASIENALHVILILEQLGISMTDIQAGLYKLSNIPMRLSLAEGVNQCLLLDDSYSFDLESLKIGLRQLEAYAMNRDKVLIISDLDEQNASIKSYKELVQILENFKLKSLFVIGNTLEKHLSEMDLSYPSKSYSHVDEFLKDGPWKDFSQDIVLIKGARDFKLDKISKRLHARQNRTVLEIDLFALSENIHFYREQVNSQSKLMAVLKASAYGSGSEQLSYLINESPIDHVAVAIVEEALELRKSGMHKPLLVFNPQVDNLDTLIEYKLDIELSNFTMADQLISYLDGNEEEISVHVKIDTGMNRLGFQKSDIDRLLPYLKHDRIKVNGIFSHLAASDDPKHDDFTRAQLNHFDAISKSIMNELGISPMRHILNTGGALRFPEFQLEMVRIGIGLYGIDLVQPNKSHLTKVHTLKSFVIQIKDVKANETVGYGNNWQLDKPAKIAVIGIGYADGLLRKAGFGQYNVLINGQKAALMGSVCMDLCMADISHLKGVKEGDVVTIFGKNHPIEDLAIAGDTIPYEILTRVAPRVKRVYIQ